MARTKHTFRLRQGDIIVAEVSGADREACFREIMRYAVEYSEDGDKCTIEGVVQSDWDAFLSALEIKPQVRH